jgi:hypothetical protein
MTPEETQRLQACLQEAAVILFGLLTISTFLKKACVLLVLGQSSRQLNSSVDG